MPVAAPGPTRSFTSVSLVVSVPVARGNFTLNPESKWARARAVCTCYLDSSS